MPHRHTIERLALFVTFLATFGELHPDCDHWAQASKTAARKRLYGEDLVHTDGTPATPNSTRPAMTTSTLGRRAVARHVASYTATQLGATIAITRALGYRVTPAALLAGSAINAGTPAAIDRVRCCCCGCGCGWRRGPERPATSSTARRSAWTTRAHSPAR
ncbi:hypothetical protein OG245_00790 [Streptomyces sp. NBC_01116]|uniref:hypothetical protein n=1 Tax=Streptomyces sp. NBC_01116 TaxID=2903752 RepID=UPI00324BC625